MRSEAAAGGRTRFEWTRACALTMVILADCATRSSTGASQPSAPRAACPLDGCAQSARLRDATSTGGACSALGHCAPSDAATCRQRALAAWSTLRDERDLPCIYRLLDDACDLGDSAACGVSGRMAIAGIGVERDESGGVEKLVSACYAGLDLYCVAGKEWLSALHHAAGVPHGDDLAVRLDLQRGCLSGMAQPCYDLGQLFDHGGNGLPADGTRAAATFARGCNIGLAQACDALGDMLWYGRGITPDRSRSVGSFQRACRLGLPNGCANLGYATEHRSRDPRDRQRARSLYVDACAGGSVYGCLHVAMLGAEDRGAPREPRAALARWSDACGRGDAQACAFVGVIWEDGPDGQARDEGKSQAAMNRACELRDDRACTWMRSLGGLDEP